MITTDTEHNVYAYFGRNNEYLYIGVSQNLGDRDKSHSKDKPWYQNEIDNFKVVERFSNREDALAFEKAQIKLHRPKYNVVYNRDKPASESKKANNPNPKASKFNPIKNQYLSPRNSRKVFVKKPIFFPLDEVDENIDIYTVRRWENDALIVDVSGQILTHMHRDLLEVIIKNYRIKGEFNKYLFSPKLIDEELVKIDFYNRYQIDSSSDWHNKFVEDLFDANLKILVKDDSKKGWKNDISTRFVFESYKETSLDTNVTSYHLCFSEDYLKYIEGLTLDYEDAINKPRKKLFA